MTRLLRRSLSALAVTCIIASCTSLPPIEPSVAAPANSTQLAEHIVHYVRSGLDGAEVEHVYVFHPNPGRVEVYKMREHCTNAALVIAEMDTARGEARRIVGGRLRRDGTQQAFAFLTLDPITRDLSVRVELPDQVITENVTIGSERLWLYDFDFADMVPAVIQDQGRATSASLAFVWPEGGEEGFLRYEGRADFFYLGASIRGGREVLHYRVGGSAFDDEGGGDLWVDRSNGVVVEARLGKPNHPGYHGFAMRLESVEAGEADTWRALLQAHFAGCPE